MARRGDFDLELRSVRAGNLSWDQFFRKTGARWRAIAERMHTCWDLPMWIATDDIVQEMMIACWRYAWIFCSSKQDQSRTQCRGIEYFSLWNSLDTSRKVATKARIGARPHRGDGQGVPSRYEIAVSAMHHDREGDDDFSVDTMVGVDATAERDALRTLVLQGLARRARGADRIALAALAARRGCIDRATIDLYRDPVLRSQLGLEDAEMGENEAGKIVRRAIRRTAGRARARSRTETASAA